VYIIIFCSFLCYLIRLVSETKYHETNWWTLLVNHTSSTFTWKVTSQRSLTTSPVDSQMFSATVSFCRIIPIPVLHFMFASDARYNVDDQTVGKNRLKIPHFYENYIKLTQLGSSTWRTDRQCIRLHIDCLLRLTLDIAMFIYRNSI